MRSFVFDTGPIISIAMNNLLWLLEPLKKISNGRFMITPLIQEELVQYPMQRTKRYMFEAMQVLHYINNQTIDVVDEKSFEDMGLDLLTLANKCFIASGHPMRLVHAAEMQALALAVMRDADVFVVDERTTRMLVEDPDRLFSLLKHKYHFKIEMDKKSVRQFQQLTKDVRIIRSVELVTVAYELGLLDEYTPPIKDGRKTLLEGLLWGVKLDGCAVSKREVEQIMRMEMQREKKG